MTNLKTLVIAAALVLIVFSAATTYANNQESTQCAIADGKVVVKNLPSNWKFNQYAGENSCAVEKTDSPENVCYLSAQMEVVVHPRQNIGKTVREWANDHALHTIDAKDPVVTDAELSGQTGNKLTYMKTNFNFDKTKSIEVVNEEYFFLTPDYALNVNIRYHEDEAPIAGKEVEAILSQIELK
jgi:hypothetical protein